jgi:hypothetical protein
VLPEVVVVALGAGRNALEKCFGPIGSMFMRLARPERFCSDRNELISSWLVMYNPKGQREATNINTSPNSTLPHPISQKMHKLRPTCSVSVRQ